MGGLKKMLEKGKRVVWLVRHGERIDNVQLDWKKSAERWDDPPLSSRGLTQATEVGQRLALENFDVLLCSPFIRCIQTLQKILETRPPPHPRIFIEPGFGESLSACNDPPGNLPVDELKKLEPRIDTSYEPVFRVLPKEGLGDITCAHRVQRAVEGILARFQGSILIVSHGSPIAASHLALVGEWNYVGQCTVSRIVEKVPHSMLTPPSTPDTDHPEEDNDERKERHQSQRWEVALKGCRKHLSDQTNLHDVQNQDKLHGRVARGRENNICD